MSLNPLDFSAPELIESFRSSVSVEAMAAGFLGMFTGAAAFAGLAVPAVARTILPSPKETQLADHLPFESVKEDGVTIVCKDGTLVQLIEVAGRDSTFFDRQTREAFMLARKNTLDALSDSSVTVRMFLLRDQTPLHIPVEHENPVLHEVASRWNESFKVSFRNRQVIMVSRSGKGKEAQEKLGEAVDIVLSYLDDYGPYVLSQYYEEARFQPLTVLGRIISPITRPQPGGVGNNVSYSLTADQVRFGGENGVIKFTSGTQEMYCTCIGFRQLGDYTDENFALEVSTLPFEVVVCHNIIPMSRGKASLAVAQKSRMTLASRFSPSTAEQFAIAEELIEGQGEVSAALMDYNQSIFIYAPTVEQLIENEKEVKRIANGYGMTPVREGMTGHASWFSMFPGFQMWPRAYKLFSHNVADEITLDRPPTGLPDSDWGPGPIAMFRTAAGSPYSFQFHVSMEPAAVAHGVTIGPTGGGKTTLMTFLSGMAMRHPNLRVYIIDRHGGAYIFTHAMGGKYVTFDASDLNGTQSALNPFQLPDTQENRAFLRNFLEALADVNDAESQEEIAFAVETLYQVPGLPKEERSLANVFDAVFAKSKPLRKRLEKWVDPTMLGGLFNAAEDTLDLTSNRLVALDFTRIYENDDIARAVILYLMHRIQSTITELRCPALIFIDETEPIVQHPMFRKFFLQMLQEYRKKGAAVISAFQRPEAIAQAGLGEAIRGQAQTNYFFPNPQAQEEEYEAWGLTERQWDYITGRLPAMRNIDRSIMIKRANGETVVLNTDLSHLGPYLKVFRSDEAAKEAANQAMEEHGDDWLNAYLKS